MVSPEETQDEESPPMVDVPSRDEAVAVSSTIADKKVPPGTTAAPPTEEETTGSQAMPPDEDDFVENIDLNRHKPARNSTQKIDQQQPATKMSSPPNATPGDRAPAAPQFTAEGLPLDYARFGSTHANSTGEETDNGEALVPEPELDKSYASAHEPAVPVPARRSSQLSSLSRPGAHAIPGIGASESSPAQEATGGEVLESGVLPALVSSNMDPSVHAYLVEDPEEVPVAEVRPIKPFWQRTEGRRTMAVVAALVAALATLLAVFLTRDDTNKSRAEQGLLGAQPALPTPSPSSHPSANPSDDSRPTLAIVRDRGILNCGVEDTVEGGAVQFGRYSADFCRLVAANVLGNPDKVNLVEVGSDRFEMLQGRGIDLLIAGDESTVSKAMKEPIWFGYPYYVATVIYIGLARYVQCAVEQKRYGECKDLALCAYDTSDVRELMESFFPGSFVRFGTFPEMEASLTDGTCNVLVSDTYRIYGSSLRDDFDPITNAGKYLVSDVHITRKQLAQAVRNDDKEWFNIVEGTRHWSGRAFQMGIGKDGSACPATNGEDFDTPSARINFFNGVHCVGNYGEIFQRSLGKHIIGLNTTYIPLIDAAKFGPLECDDCDDALVTDPYLKDIVDEGKLRCGIYLDQSLNITAASVSTLIAEQLCRASAVAIFQGDPGAAEITHLNEIDVSVFPDDYDVMFGLSWADVMSNDEGEYLGRDDEWSPSIAYFFHEQFLRSGRTYGGIGKTDIFMTSTKRAGEDSNTFPIILIAVFNAVVYAQRKRISRSTASQMPRIELLGEGLTFMLRDVVAFAGNYDDIFNEAHFMSDKLTGRGFNFVVQDYDLAPKMPTIFCDGQGVCPPREFAFDLGNGAYYWNYEY